MAFVDLKRGIDDAGREWVLCPSCFETNELTSAREGGRLSTTDNGKQVWDLCIDCSARDWLQFANMMGA